MKYLWPFNGLYLNRFALSINAINRLGNHTGKKEHTTSARLADFYLNPFKFVAYRNNCFISHTNPYNYFERYATVPMVIQSNLP